LRPEGWEKPRGEETKRLRDEETGGLILKGWNDPRFQIADLRKERARRAGSFRE
jgi:hypothetical protein